MLKIRYYLNYKSKLFAALAYHFHAKVRSGGGVVVGCCKLFGFGETRKSESNGRHVFGDFAHCVYLIPPFVSLNGLSLPARARW